MRSPFPRIAPASLCIVPGKRCQRVTKADFDPPSVFLSREGRVGGTKFPMNSLRFFSNRVTGSWMVAYRSMQKERGKKENKNVCVYRCQRLTDFFFVGEERKRNNRNKRTWKRVIKREKLKLVVRREKLTREDLWGRLIKVDGKVGGEGGGRWKLPLRRNIKRHPRKIIIGIGRYLEAFTRCQERR